MKPEAKNFFQSGSANGDLLKITRSLTESLGVVGGGDILTRALPSQFGVQKTSEFRDNSPKGWVWTSQVL